MFRDDEFTRILNAELYKAPVPELPKTVEECQELLKKRYEVMHEGKSVATVGNGFGTGGESANIITLKCPFCSAKFEGIHRYGCFHDRVEPHDCPNCGFPFNIIRQLHILVKQKEGV